MTAIKTRRSYRNLVRLVVAAAAAVFMSGHGDLMAQAVLDLCGCKDDPTLQPFNAGNPATYPAGTSGCASTCTGGTIVLTPPPSGVFKFSSFTMNGTFNLFFNRNAANTPITILVAGDVSIQNPSFCCTEVSVSGGNGSSGSTIAGGVGGGSGNGGFRGGDGAAQGVNGSSIGGTGFGPGGGLGGTPALAAAGGAFIGVPELLPMLGASGGGGGASFGTSTNCTGGGGGGGGGGLLIVANGLMTLTNTDLTAQGGSGGSVGNGACATGGGGGSGGAIRLVARSFASGGNARLWTQGAVSGFVAGTGTNGRVRLESVDLTAQTQFATFPATALRITGPGPISNPITPTVRITSVGGAPVPAPSTGHLGLIDITLAAPAVTSVDVATAGVPSGTTVEVKVKSRFGVAPLTSLVPLTNCDQQGNCVATTTFSLTAGAHVVEARATFQVQ